jgi:hypothetical protein
MNVNTFRALSRRSVLGSALVWLAIGSSFTIGARAQTAANPLPTFPQPFTLNSPVPAGFALAVTQPGPVVVDVDSAGAPVTVTLQTAGLQPMQRQGVGHIELAYNVTPADVQRSKLWVLTVALVPPPPLVPAPTANGTIQVHQPPADVAAAVAEANAIARMPKTHTGPGAEDRARLEAARAAAQAQYDQRVRQAQAQREALNAPLVNQLRAASSNTSNTLGTRSLPALSAAPVVGVPVQNTAPPPVSTLPVTPVPVKATTPPPPPVITALQSSVNAALTQAGPLDQMVIVGKNFGTVQSDVVFKVGSNTFATTSLPGCWSDTLIVVKVPDISGFSQGAAGVWVQLNPASSNVASFTFTPALEYRHIYWTNDRSLSPGAQVSYVAATGMGDVYHSNTSFASMGGATGNDNFFFNTPLNAGWAPQGISLVVYGTGMPAGPGGVYLQQSGISANPPALRFNARWYYNALQDIDYGFDVMIAGPRGTPDGVLVTH